MPKGEPTEVIRLPKWLLNVHRPAAEKAGVSLSEYLTKKLAPQGVPLRQPTPVVTRCRCDDPKPSRFATNVCTACGMAR